MNKSPLFPLPFDRSSRYLLQDSRFSTSQRHRTALPLSEIPRTSIIMRTTTLLTVASLFLIGSFSLPQPESVEASRTIEDREARVAPGGPLPSFSDGAEWRNHHHDGGEPPASNGTKIKERQEHHGMPGGPPEFFEHHHDGSGTTSTNETKIKERQGPPEGGPPEGMTWMEFMKHRKHKGGSSSQSASVPLSTGTSTLNEDSTDLSTTGTESNSTKVRMMKFRD